MLPWSRFSAALALVFITQISSSTRGQVVTGEIELLHDVAIKHHWVGEEVQDVSPVDWSWNLQQQVYDPSVPGVYAPIGTSFGLDLTNITPADVGRTLRLDGANADEYGFDWERFADWAWNSLPFVEAEFGRVGGVVAAMETIESPAGPGQTRLPEYNFIGGTWPGSRQLLVDRLEFTLEDFSRHSTNQPFSLLPGTQLRMRVELYGVRTVPEPATISTVGVAMLCFSTRRPRQEAWAGQTL